MAHRRPHALLSAGRAVALTGVGLVLAGAVHVPRWLADPAWRKPVIFAGSFGLSSLAFAWVLAQLRPSRTSGLAAAIWVAAASGEVALALMQAWRREASHFNLATPFDATVHWTMAALAGAIWVAVALWTGLAHRDATLRGPERVAVLTGLWLVHASFGVGVLLSVHGTSAAVAGGEATAVFGANGHMLPPHAIGLHAIQLLAVACAALRWSGRTRPDAARWVWRIAAALVALMSFAVAQMLLGRGPLDPSAISLAAAAVSALGVLGRRPPV